MQTKHTLENTEASAVKVTRRFERLNDLICDYKHLWPESYRLEKWVDEYNRLRENHRAVFDKYCEKHGYCLTHNGYDTLA
jgi:hypothetical protein